jgi:hypothetical protein
MAVSERFKDRCPRIAPARMGLQEWEDYIQGWVDAQPDARKLFPNKEAYLHYLRLEGFSSGARLAASVVWDIDSIGTFYGE